MNGRTSIAVVVLVGVIACGTEEKRPLGSTNSGGGTGGDSGSTTTTSEAGHGGTGGGAGGATGGGGAGGGSPELQVFFIGSKPTYTNQLPELVRDLSTAQEPTIVVTAVTVPHVTLQNHYDFTGAVGVIQWGGWHAVVLQGDNIEPLFDPATFHSAVLAFDAEIDAVGAETVLFETWAFAPGHTAYNETWFGGNPTAMQAGLRAEYLAAAAATGGVMAPVGDAWETSLVSHPIIQLHWSDGSAPTIAGTYLAACMLYLVITGHQTIASPAPASTGLSEPEAATLRLVAEATPW